MVSKMEDQKWTMLLENELCNPCQGGNPYSPGITKKKLFNTNLVPKI